MTANAHDLPRFGRHFAGSGESISSLGGGAIGGKAHGLLEARRLLARFDAKRHPRIRVAVPSFTVLGTEVFDAFLDANQLRSLALSDAGDRVIAAAFQRAPLPADLVGDLFALARDIKTPLAVRSSSLLEDALAHPFAGVYGTKMIPNNQLDPETRFRKLAEAVKFVWASTFSLAAKSYARAAGRELAEEKMGVLVQEVVGLRRGPRFYPDISGVARSYNFYPSGHARPQDGVVNLALGLGKTIVDGGRSWTYSPAWPGVRPPVAPPQRLLDETQREFWAVNMGSPPAYDPLAETEYLLQAGLADAETDGSLRLTASTFDPRSDRIVLGTAAAGPRLLDFAPVLVMDELPLNPLLRDLLAAFEEAAGTDVEIEFALAAPGNGPAFLGFLQVRPMSVPSAQIELSAADLDHPGAVVASEGTMGNGCWEGVTDIVFVKRGSFDAKHTRAIAKDVEGANTRLSNAGRPYVLIGFGRWGTSDPWLGVPVTWSQIAGARALVESTLPAMDVQLSQGAHFFHNLLSFGVPYFAVSHHAAHGIAWDWLESLPVEFETPFIRQVRTPAPLRIKVDGRSGRGLVLRPEAGSA